MESRAGKYLAGFVPTPLVTQGHQGPLARRRPLRARHRGRLVPQRAYRGGSGASCSASPRSGPGTCSRAPPSRTGGRPAWSSCENEIWPIFIPGRQHDRQVGHVRQLEGELAVPARDRRSPQSSGSAGRAARASSCPRAARRCRRAARCARPSCRARTPRGAARTAPRRSRSTRSMSPSCSAARVDVGVARVAEHLEVVAEVQVDARGLDVGRIERLDDDPPCGELLFDRPVREHHAHVSFDEFGPRSARAERSLRCERSRYAHLL